MATESLTSWAEFLKIIFVQPNIGKAMNQNFWLYRMLHDRADNIRFGGREFRFPVQDQRQEGIGPVADGSSTLPTATVSNGLEAVFNVKNVYGIGEIDDMLIEDSRPGGGMSYADGLEKTRDDLLLSMKQDLTCAWYDDGRARLAIMPAADNDTTVTVSQPNFIRKGKRIDCIDDTDGYTKLSDSGVCSSVSHAIDSGTSTIVTNVAVAGSATGDFFVGEDWIGAAGAQLMPYGILAGCDNANPTLANYGGINRSTAGNEKWKGNIVGTSGTNIAFTVRQVADLLTLMRRNGSVPVSDVVGITNWDVIQTMFEQVAPDRQITIRGAEALQIEPGYKTMTGEAGSIAAHVSGIDIHADEYAPANSIFFLNLPSWYIYQTSDPELIDRDGAVLHRFESRPAYQFRWKYRHEVVTNCPSANGILQGVAQA